MWAKMPATMIRKVAIVSALREAFPDKFQGMYDQSEMGQDGTLPENEIPQDLSKLPIDAKQKKALTELLGSDKEKIAIAQKVLKNYGYTSLKDIQNGDYDSIMDALQDAFMELDVVEAKVIDIEAEPDLNEIELAEMYEEAQE